MKNPTRYVIFSLLFVICYLLFVITPVYAQSMNPGPQNSYTAPNTNPDVPNNLHDYTQNVLIEVMSATACQLTGIDPTSPSQQCLGVDPITKKIGFVNGDGGAIGFMGNMITMLYTPPAHTADYIRNLAQNFGITKPAYASWSRGWGSIPAPSPAPSAQQNVAGTGFTGLSPLLKTWEVFRNFAYLIFVLVFIIIGIAIMLRVKIDPRTVMSIQNQIPKLIIGILIVTFSFAIAGFLIDIMWIAIYLFYGVFNSIAGVDVTSLNPQNMVGVTPIGAVGGFGGIGDIAMHGSGSIKDVITSLFNNSVGDIFGRILGALIGGTSGGGIGALIGGVVGAVGANFLAPGLGTGPGAMAGVSLGAKLGSVVGGLYGATAGAGKVIGQLGAIVAFLIIAIALLWALIRLWFTLLTAYIMILIDVVLAPFWIIAGAFPGSTISFTSWVRDIVANLAAFPAAIVMFLLGKTFIDAFATSTPGQFVPPLVGNPGDIKSFGALIGLGIILTTPNMVKILKEALKAPKIDLSAAGQAIGVGAGYPISVGRGVGQTMIGRDEAIMRRNPAGQYEWGARGIGRTFFGRFFR